MPQTLQAWAEEARRSTRDGFVRRFAGPFLLVFDEGSPPADRSFLVTTAKLVAVRPGQTAPPTPASPAREVVVHPVAKRPGVLSPFPTMVTLGRAANNDIVMPSPGVSTFHAYLAQEAGAWVLRDADSTHGTFVGEARISAPTPLAPEAGLRFGEVRARFVDTAGLYRAAVFGL